jgi:hypothetical protein
MKLLLFGSGTYGYGEENFFKINQGFGLSLTLK